MNGYPDECPECKTSFIGQKIPPEMEESFGEGNFSKNIVGLSNWDSIVAWRCLECKHKWDREGWKNGKRVNTREAW